MLSRGWQKEKNLRFYQMWLWQIGVAVLKGSYGSSNCGIRQSSENMTGDNKAYKALYVIYFMMAISH